MRILVTGATGYIGGRLIPRLLERGHEVFALVRDPGRIAGRSWGSQVRILHGSLLDDADFLLNCPAMDAAYYLVHSMHSGHDFQTLDRRAAEHFCHLAASIPLTIYLGGLVPENARASAHLASRRETGEILRKNLPVTEFRAGPIIGSGSASFEMVRYLTDRLPAMIAPRWILNEVQPIAVRDILSYLLQALEKPPLGILDVGSDVLTFQQMMLRYAQIKGYRRWIVPVPVLAPRLAALWVGFVTPIPNRLAVPLIQGVIQPLIGDIRRSRKLFPDIIPISYSNAVTLAVEKTSRGLIETRWSGAMGGSSTYELVDWEGLIREVRRIPVNAPPADVFRGFCGIGGERGWQVWDWAWKARGLLDRIVGGPGLRRGRRHRDQLLPGEALDFWRVEKVIENRLLRLRAEMKVPGKAWLQWEVFPENGTSILVQTAFFEPDGMWGFLYWYAAYPLHKLIFSDLAQAVGKMARPAPAS